MDGFAHGQATPRCVTWFDFELESSFMIIYNYPCTRSTIRASRMESKLYGCVVESAYGFH